MTLPHHPDAPTESSSDFVAAAVACLEIAFSTAVPLVLCIVRLSAVLPASTTSDYHR